MKIIKIAKMREKRLANVMDSRQKIFWVAKYVLELIKEAMANSKDGNQLYDNIYLISKSRGIKKGNIIILPKEIDPSQKLTFVIYPRSGDGKTGAEAIESQISLYTDVIMERGVQSIYGVIIHELAHIYEEWGTSPDDDEEDAGKRTVLYLTNSGEINSHAWELALTYTQMFSGQEFNISNVKQLAENNKKAYIYLVQFPSPEIQKKYSGIADLNQAYNTFVTKMKQFVDYINKMNNMDQLNENN